MLLDEPRIDSQGQPSPPPRGPWVMRMEWSDLLFAHWPLPPAQVAALLPSGLALDTFEGQAWLGVVPFEMQGTRPRFSPLLPFVSRFAELNVRTYVTLEGRPGVWFFSLDAASRIAVRAARLGFHLPYLDAKMRCSRDGDAIDYRSERTEPPIPARFRGRYRPLGPPAPTRPGTLEHWLTARFCLYAADRRRRLYRAEITHAPWELAPAEARLEENTMADPLGFSLEGAPLLHFSRHIDVRGWLPERVSR